MQKNRSKKFTTNVSWWSDVNEKNHDHVIHFKRHGLSSESFLFTKTLPCKESLITLKTETVEVQSNPLSLIRPIYVFFFF